MVMALASMGVQITMNVMSIMEDVTKLPIASIFQAVICASVQVDSSATALVIQDA